MTTEYIKFSVPERIYGDKNLLHSELELLGIIKRIRNYKKLRKDDLILKLTLKKKIEEFLDNLQLLDRLLPQDKLPGLDRKKREEELMEMKGELSLEQEIEVIRRRLEKLQNS